MQVDTIADKLFFTTIRIDTIAPDGSGSSGTGFFFSLAIGDNRYPFIVTNKHVVFGMKSGTLSFLKAKEGKPDLGEGFKLTLDNWENSWFGHPDKDIDIAICPLLPLETFIKEKHGVDIFYRTITSDITISPELLEQIDAIESVTFVGYPNGIWDTKNLLPVARRGTTASPLVVDFENTPRFLIDASVFGGSSGSPVFIFNQGMYSNTRRNSVSMSDRIIFVGVISAVFYRTQLNEIISVPIPTQVKSMSMNSEMIDLGIVFKASTVTDAISIFLKNHGII